MSEDVNTTPEGDAATEAPEPKAPGIPQEYAWVNDPKAAYEGVLKLQEKSEARLNQLTDLQTRLEALETEKRTAAEQALAEQGEFKELADARAKEIEALKQQMTEQVNAAKRKDLEMTVLAKASFLGFADPADAINLMDITQLENEDAAITDALKALADSKPYLLKGQQEQQRKLSPLNTNDQSKASDVRQWHPLTRTPGSTFGDGGVQPPGE